MLLSFSDVSTGAPLCLLHGLFGRSQNFATLARTCATNRRVISMDLRNHGASPHAPGVSYAAMADDVLETLDTIGALPCSILGHSMGGKVAMTLALTSPAAVERLIVADIAPIAYKHNNAAVAAAMLALDLSPGLDRRRADAALALSVPDPAIRGFLLQNLVFGLAPHWRIGLAEIAAGLPQIEGWAECGAPYAGPTMFIRGGASDYVPDAAWPAIQRLFPAARLVTLAAAGHWLHAEQPSAFATSVKNMLAIAG